MRGEAVPILAPSMHDRTLDAACPSCVLYVRTYIQTSAAALKEMKSTKEGQDTQGTSYFPMDTLSSPFTLRDESLSFI